MTHNSDLAGSGRLCEHLLVGICGSIHALQIHSYLALFRESLTPDIKVIVTRSARRMVHPRTIQLYTDDRVFGDLWDQSPSIDRAPHIQLTRWADLFVVVPTTANMLGKVAHGMADDLLSTSILSYPKPVVFAPAMNPAMWESRTVRRNVQTIESDGHVVVTPEPAVSLTSGDWDLGLAPSPATLLPHLQHVRMKELRSEYWDEATRTKPLTPAQRKLRELAQATAARDDTP